MADICRSPRKSRTLGTLTLTYRAYIALGPPSRPDLLIPGEWVRYAIAEQQQRGRRVAQAAS